MDTSQAMPAGAVAAPDLADVVHRDGPFLTVHLTTEAGIENASQRSQQRWKTLRTDLGDRGVPEEVLGHVDPLIPEAHLFGDGLAVVADGRGVARVEHGPVPGPQDEGWWEPIPRLRTVIGWRQAAPPFVVVLTDRRGADLYAFLRGPDGAPNVEQSVDGDAYPLRKVGPGGWSQRRFQERAENTWEENAGGVAEAAAALVRRVEGRLLIVAGDVRAVEMLRDALPDDLPARLETVAGERPWEGSGGTIPDEVGDIVRGLVDREIRELLERFREERGQADLATDGFAATTAALVSGQVAVLLLHDDAPDEPELWVGPDPAQIAASAEDLARFGVEDPEAAPGPEAMIRTALATGASIAVVPADAGLADGVGALLRWST